MADIIQQYESLDAMFAHIKAHPRSMVAERTETSFFGRGTAGAMDYVERGASEWEQAPTMALLDKIDAGIERTRREYVGGPAGAFVNVPEYLAGMPMHMRRSVHTTAEAAPVRIVVETLVSAGVSAAQLARRGAAVSALAMRLGELRPLELWASWGMQSRYRNVIGRVKIDTQPLNVGRLCAVMNSREFMRSITFANMGAELGCNGNTAITWAWGADPTADSRNNLMREALNLEPTDIFIPGGYLSESDMMMCDPVAWVNKYLDAQREAE